MAFDKQTAQEAREAFDEIMKAFPKKKVGEFFGHFNEVSLFLNDAQRAAPARKEGP